MITLLLSNFSGRSRNRAEVPGGSESWGGGEKVLTLEEPFGNQLAGPAGSAR